MKICNIYIKNFEQFQNVVLDFTNPETGEPVEKICFIGRNGTGKSKILRMINWFFHSMLESLISTRRIPNLGDNDEGKLIFKIILDSKPILLVYFKLQVEVVKIERLDKNEELQLINDLLTLETPLEIRDRINSNNLIESSPHTSLLKRLIVESNSADLVIYSPDESRANGYLTITDVPQTNVNDAQALFQNFPVFVEVSSDTVNEFWKLLVFNMRRREEERTNYETSPENINKTKARLIDEFDKLSPKILNDLAEIWNQILDNAGLEFDAKSANNPYQLNDNLKAYIKLKKTDQIIKYNELSTGIRNFIFRIGHIYSLYFNRQIDRGFLLIDEPENGLFPDFLFDLMRIYQQIVIDKDGNNNTQMFFATHNPIIAAQFKPFERIILDWNDDATVKVYKGVAPEGDDPNDVLKKDFGLHELMGPVGIQQWANYLSLKKQLKKTESSEEKMNIAAAINKIGQSYNFPA